MHIDPHTQETVIRIDGKVKARLAGTENPNLATGAVEVVVTQPSFRTLCGLTPTIVGTQGADIITGTPGDDVIRARREPHRHRPRDPLVQPREPLLAQPLLEPSRPDIARRDGIDPDGRRRRFVRRPGWRGPGLAEPLVPGGGSAGVHDAELVRAGQGVGVLPRFLIRAEIDSGRLVPLLETFAAPPNGIDAVFPQRKPLPLRVRLWVDFLKHHYGHPGFWQTRRAGSRA